MQFDIQTQFSTFFFFLLKMVHCQYCLKDLPKGQKTTTYYFIVIDAGTVLPKTKSGIRKHVDDHHHQIDVCPGCEKNIFVEREAESASPKRSPKRKSASPKRKTASPKRKSASPKRKSASPKRKTASPKRSPKRKSASPKRSPKRKTASPKRK